MTPELLPPRAVAALLQAAAAVIHARDWPPIYQKFVQLRTARVAQVAALSAADLPRGGQHPAVGPLTVNDLLHEWVHHDRNHIRQMLANAQAHARPHMGNAQRFSQP